jgi:hypothetical protein
MLHALTFRVFGTNPELFQEALSRINVILIILLIPIIILSTWGTFFSFVSGISIALTMSQHGQECPEKLGKDLQGRFMSSFLIIIVHYIWLFLLNHTFLLNGVKYYSVITGALELGHSVLPSIEVIFPAGTLESIGISGIFISLVLYGLWRKKGFTDPKKTYFVLIGLAVTWLLLTIILDKYSPGIIAQLRADGHHVAAFFLMKIMGGRLSAFPTVAFALFGAVFGIALSQKESLRRIKKFGYGFGVTGLIIFAIYVLVKGIKPEAFVAEIIPLPLHIFNLSLMLIFTVWLFQRYDYSSPEKRIIYAKRTTMIRRVGMTSLTVYLFESLVSVMIWRIFIIIGGNDIFPWNFGILLLYLFLVEFAWYGILRLWEKNSFKYSVEWFIVQIVGWTRGRKSSRLDIAETLYNPVKVCVDEPHSELIE